jgi:hypothetical protein
VTPTDFVTWLQGVADVLGDEPPTKERWERIVKQLSEVRVTPAPAPLTWPTLNPPPVPVQPPAWPTWTVWSAGNCGPEVTSTAVIDFSKTTTHRL